jgi:hypothetical protein
MQQRTCSPSLDGFLLRALLCIDLSRTLTHTCKTAAVNESVSWIDCGQPGTGIEVGCKFRQRFLKQLAPLFTASLLRWCARCRCIARRAVRVWQHALSASLARRPAEHTLRVFSMTAFPASEPCCRLRAHPVCSVLRGSTTPVPKTSRPGASRPSRRSALTVPPAIARGYARYVKLAKRFPGVEESTAYGTPALKVKGKILSRWRTEAEGALALYCDFIDREMLLQADPEVFFLTDHYRDYPMVLIRLDKVRSAALPDLIERAWRMRASKTLLQRFDATAAR